MKIISNYYVLTILAAIGFFISVNISFAGKATKYQFKLATLAPERSIWINTYNSIASEVSTLTNEEVKFKCYPGGIQGDEQTVLRKIRIGQLQGAGFTGTGLSMICKNSLVLQLPHVFKSYEEFDYVFSQMKPDLEKQCQDNGYEVLGWPHLGFIYLFSKDVVADIESLRSAKPWLVEDDVISRAMFEAAGVTGVPAQIGDVLTGLRSGLIRTVFSPPIGMLTLQWFTRIENRLDIRGMYYFGAFVVLKNKWGKLPLEYQKEIKEIADVEFALLNKKVREQNDEALEVMHNNQIKTIPITQKGLNEFSQTSEKVSQKLVGKSFTDQSLSSMQRHLMEYRANHDHE